MVFHVKQLKEIVSYLPDAPGVYQFLDASGKVIYVGKAKNLKKRVSSYFYARADHPPKVRVMVAKICDIKHITVPTERDALLLENNLIKQLRPRYNILLKDDKTYPWLCVSKEDFPRVYQSRKMDKTKAYYYGPYPNNIILRTLLDFIESNYQIRTCKLNFSEQSLEKRTYRVCVKYHIKRCLGPCAKLQSRDAYMLMIEQVKSILNGNTKEVERALEQKIKEASKVLDFEEAHNIQKNLKLLLSYRDKTMVEGQLMGNYSVIAYAQNGSTIYATYLYLIDGRIVRSYNYHFLSNIELTNEDIVSSIVGQILYLYDELPGVLLLKEAIELDFRNLEILVPIRGDKYRLLKYAEELLMQYKREIEYQQALLHPLPKHERVLSTLQKALHMDKLPAHIECFDNSNIQGEHPVAACVVFKQAKPARSEYRHFNIKTVIGADDFASMEEVVYRRYSRMMEEKSPLPDLIVIDGGRGQVHSAYKSLQRLGIEEQVTLVGLAKRMEEIIFLDDPIPLFLDRNSEALKLMIQIRDEVHRFGITHHRNKRSKAQLDNELMHIPGIGPKTVELLRDEFGSLSRILAADDQRLCELIGSKKTNLLRAHFRKS